MKRVLLVVLLAAFSASAVSAGAIISGFRARTQIDRVVLAWHVESEASVSGYRIERRSADESTFHTVAQIAPQGAPGDYEYIDASLHKRADLDRYTYRLYAVASDNTLMFETEVQYQSTAVRRTWGSIKAMFR